MKKLVACCVISTLVMPFLTGCQVVQTTQTVTTRKRPNFEFSGTPSRTSTVLTLEGICEFNNVGGTITFTGDFTQSPLEVECDADDEEFSTFVTMNGPEEVKTIEAEYQTYKFSTEVELDTTPPDNMTGISPVHQSIRYNNVTTLAQTEVDLRVPCEFGGTDVEISGDFAESPLKIACNSTEEVRTTINLANSNYSDAQGENTISINQEDDVGNASNETFTLYVPLMFYVSNSFGNDATAVEGDEDLPWLTVAAALTAAETYVSGLTSPTDNVQETTSNEEALAILTLGIGTYAELFLSSDWNPLIHIHGRNSDRDQTILGGINAVGTDATDDNASDGICPTAPTDGFDVTIRSNGLVDLRNINTIGGGWGSKDDGDCVAEGYTAAAGGNVTLYNAYTTGFIATYSGSGGDATGNPGTVYLDSSDVGSIFANSRGTDANSVVASPSLPPAGGNVSIVNGSSAVGIYSNGVENMVDGSGSAGGTIIVRSSSVGPIESKGGGSVLGVSGGNVTITESSYASGTVDVTGGVGASGGTILVSDFSTTGTLTANGNTAGSGGTITVTDNSIASTVSANGNGAGGVGGTIEVSDNSDVVSVNAVGGTDAAGGTINFLDSSASGSLNANAGAGNDARGGTIAITRSTIGVDVYARGSSGAVDNGDGGTVTLVDNTTVVGDVIATPGSGIGIGGAAGSVTVDGTSSASSVSF